jgi:transposase-like protein
MPYSIKIDNTLYADDQGTTVFTRAIALALDETINGKLVQVCPQCHSSRLIKHGIDRTVKEPKQKYLCKDCKYTWREDPKPGIRNQYSASIQAHENKSLTLSSNRRSHLTHQNKCKKS